MEDNKNKNKKNNMQNKNIAHNGDLLGGLLKPIINQENGGISSKLGNIGNEDHKSLFKDN